MNALPVIISIATALLSLVFAMFTLVFLLAAGANSTPAQVRELKLMCWSLVIATAIAVAVMIALLIMKRPWWSVASASAPAALSIVLLIILFVRGDRSSELPPDGFMNARQKAIARAKQAPVQHPEPIAQSTAEENAMPSDKLRKFNDRKEAERQEFLKHVETLELAGELKAMEDAIMKRDNSLWSCCHVADMYRRRMIRLKDAGDIAGAEAAFSKSYDWMCTFASCATSGGEGMANSMARDEHLEKLTMDMGYRPASVTPWNS